MQKREERLAKLAADTDCVVTLAQLRDTGYSEDELETLVARGVWQRPQRGVYLLSAGTPTWRQQARAAVLAAGKHAQLFGRALAAWKGLDGATEGVVEVVVPYVDGEHFELDLAYLATSDAIEVDSKRWHSTTTQKAKDRHKQEACESVGWTFLRITSTDVYGRPEWVVEQIRALVCGVAAA